jgi:hypothetical protein
MNLTEFVFGALEILHYVEVRRIDWKHFSTTTKSRLFYILRFHSQRKSVKLQQLPTLDDALAWLTLARDSEANGHNQHILFKYSLSVLVATPLRDAPTRVSRNPAQIESPLKSLLRDMLLSNSPLVSTADIAVAFGVQFGARALDATIADSLARFASNPHAQSPQQVTSALELVLVLLKHHLSVNAIER